MPGMAKAAIPNNTATKPRKASAHQLRAKTINKIHLLLPQQELQSGLRAAATPYAGQNGDASARRGCFR
jgi:hypothetical protein